MDDYTSSIRLRYAAIAGLCTLFLLLPATLRDMLVYFGLLPNNNPLVVIVFVLLFLLLQVTSMVYTYGFVLIASKYRIVSLRVAAYVQILTRLRA